MTTIITRVFPDIATARKAVSRLEFRGLPKRDREIITAGEEAEAQMRRAKVHESAIGPYSQMLEAGNVLLVIHASYRPLGVARLAREVLAKHDTVDPGDAVQEHRIPWEPDHAPSILKDHPQFFSVEGIMPAGRISEMFGIPMLRKRREKRSIISGGRRMSRAFWPMPLLKDRRSSNSAISGGRHMSRAFWPMPLVTSGQRRKSVNPGGGHPFSRTFGMKLISRRT